MKIIIRFLLVAALCAGCVSHPVKSPTRRVIKVVTVQDAPAPVPQVAVAAPITDSPAVVQELAALRSSPAPVAAVVPVKPVAAPVPVVEKPTEIPASQPVSPAKAKRISKLVYRGLALLFIGLIAWATELLWLPRIQEVLAWIKSKNVVANLKTLASKAETKLAVDFNEVEKNVVSEVSRIEKGNPFKSSEPAPAPITAPTVTQPPVAVPVVVAEVKKP